MSNSKKSLLSLTPAPSADILKAAIGKNANRVSKIYQALYKYWFVVPIGIELRKAGGSGQLMGKSIHVS